MCGISGIINFQNKKIKRHIVKKMIMKIKHRGPDDEGYYFNKNIALGFVRLSIIDLTKAGNQPMYSNDNRFVIVFNGEIYNYLELKKSLKYNFKSNSDTEVILASFIEWGKDCLNKFNGMFSFVIYDNVKQEVFAARDRYGIKPFYYFLDNENFIFSSEIKSILAIKKNNFVNENLMYDYLAYNRVDHTGNTFFSSIKKLKKGHYFLIRNNKVKFYNWYNLNDKILNKKIDLSSTEYNNLLTDSIKIRLRSDVKLGVSLSGGLDSSGITSIILNNLGVNDLNTFSSVYNSNKNYDESNYINCYKGSVNKMHFVYPSKDTFLDDCEDFIYTQTEPVNDVGSYIQYKVMQIVSEHVTVVLDGQGADEQLAGYHYFFGSYYKGLLLNNNFYKLIKELIYYLIKHKSLDSIKYFIFYLLPLSFKKTYNIQLKSINYDFLNTFKDESTVPEKLYNPIDLQDSLIQHFNYKLEHLLKWDDLNSMRFSVESRLPFLDYRLVEKSINLLSSLIIKNGMTKFILRKSVKDIVPKKIINRIDKKGFSNPRKEWFKSNKFKELVFDILNSQDFSNFNYFDKNKSIKLYNDHLEGKADYSKEIWKWINVYKWNKKFIKS